MKLFEGSRECESCNGTGVYCGMGECKGAAVVCRACDGTGEEKISISGKPFKARRKKMGVSRVWEINPGIGLKPGVTEGGISYADFFAWKLFPKRGAELRSHSCPAWWYQSANYKRKPEWKDCQDSWASSFPACKHFTDKQKCWKRFDREGK